MPIKKSKFLRGVLCAAMCSTLAASAHASLLPPELEDKMANFLAWFVLIVMPPLGIALFWLVHILPEKVAHQRHHPQFDGIKTLCLLSLLFGGLLWPIAWLWAYTKPVAYRMAYGTDKHDDYYVEHGKRLAELPTDDAVKAEVAHLREELEQMARVRKLPQELEALRAQLAARHQGGNA